MKGSPLPANSLFVLAESAAASFIVSSISSIFPSLGTKHGIPSFIGKETPIESLIREAVSSLNLKGCLESGQTRISERVLLSPVPASFRRDLHNLTIIALLQYLNPVTFSFGLIVVMIPWPGPFRLLALWEPFSNAPLQL